MWRRIGPTCVPAACAPDPPAMTVEVTLAAVAPSGFGMPARFWDELTPEERARAGRYRREQDRVLFVAARGVLREALRRRFGVAWVHVAAPPDGGKPRLAGDGLPPRLDFNLSHADGMVACALGVGVEVGVDVERLDRAGSDLVADLAAARLAPEERAGLRDAAGFLRLWTLKEAVAKAVGLGLALPFDRFACASDPPRLTRSAPELGEADAWRLDQWCDGAHVAALAVRGPPSGPARMRRVDLAAL